MNNYSLGEEKIITILKKEKIPFEREKTFKDLKHGLYRYDFYLPSLNVLIEFDGQQHFTQVKKFHKTRQEYLKAREHDRQKNTYALAHSITLYRIPYWEITEVNSLKDIMQNKFKVVTKWHNDNLNYRVH